MFRPVMVLCCFIISCSCRAQFRDEFNYHFKQYNVADGLPDNAVVKTIKDKHGFLWIATLNGISRFDGTLFRNYTSQQPAISGLRSGWTSDIMLDDQQQLWASTEGGLCYYDEPTDRFVYINTPDQLQLIFRMPLTKGGGRTVWLVAENGLKKINSITKTYTATALQRVVDPQFVIPVNGNKLLIGTRGNGLIQYDIAADRYNKVSIPGLPADTHFMGAMNDGNKTWVACSEGLLLEENGTYSLYNRFAGNNNSVVKALMCVTNFDKAFGRRYLLCGSYDKKLILFDTQTKLFSYQWTAGYSNPAGFTAAILNDLYADGDQLWIAGNRGLQLLNLEAQQQHSYFIEGLHDPGQSVSVKKAIVYNETSTHEVWMIPFQSVGGIIRYNLATRKIKKHYNKSEPGSGIHYFDIIKTSFPGGIVAAGENRIDFYNASHGFLHSIQVDGNIRCVKEDSRGNLWAGTDEGIAFVEKGSRRAQLFRHRYRGTELENNTIGGPFPVYDIEMANDSMLYISNLKYGLFDFNTRTHTFTAHRIPSKASFSTDNRSVALALNGSDTLYTGTYNGLMGYSISLQHFVSNFTKRLPGPVYVYSLLTDSSKRIWARTNHGVLCYIPVTGKIISFKIKGEADINYFQQKLALYDSTHIMMGHEGGFSILNTAAILEQQLPSTILYMNKVLLNNNDLYFKRDSAAVWAFDHRQNQLSFQVAAIDFNNPEGIEYYYKLEGLDKDWKEAGSKNIYNYNFLPPGKYRFCIYARNNINQAQSQVLYFAFIIQPAWWQHWWLWPLVTLLFGIVVVFAARRRIKIIRRREREQTRQNKMLAELELKMLRSQMNPHFIFNSLNSIQKYIWQNKEEDAAEYLSRFAKLMRAILEHSRKEVVSLKDEIDVMKLYIELEHRRSNGSFEYNMHIDESLDPGKTLIPPMIMQPFIENAIWHGLNKKQGKGQLDISVKKKEDQLVCRIEDDGQGFDTGKPIVKDGPASLGIEITRQRLEKLMHSTGMKSEVQIRSQVTEDENEKTGTIVTIFLPLQTI